MIFSIYFLGRPRQAVTPWTVDKKLNAVSVNFDLDRNGLLDVSLGLQETGAIYAVADPNTTVNVFFVNRPNDGALGCTLGTNALVFVDQHTPQNVNNTIAHELGHALGLEHPDVFGDPDPENLMHSSNPGVTRLRKGQWDTIQSSVPRPLG